MTEKMTLYLEENLAKKITKESRLNKRSKNNMVNFMLSDYFTHKNEDDRIKNEDKDK